MTATAASGVLERALTDLPARLTWLDGRRLAVAGASLDTTGGVGAAALAGQLYADWYARASPSGPVDPGDDVAEALRAAHAAAARFEPGWRAARVSSAGRVLAERGGETRLLHPVDFVCPSRPGLPPQPGVEVLVVARRDSPEPVEGYWMTWGRGWPPADGRPLVRVYWNVGVEAAPALVSALTAALGGLALPWSLKLPVDARQHARADAAVLYLPRRDYAAAAPALRGVAGALRDRLLAAEPPLALRLTAGVALAEDPGGEESFGTSRCRLLAEGIAAAAGAEPPSAPALLTAIRARFTAAGLDPDRPHLEPGSGSEYAWEGVSPVAPPAPARASRLPGRAPARAPAPSDGFLAAARTVAGRLVAEAIWGGERCTWVGDALEPTDGAWSVVLRSCDGGLYAGTAGIAWFLACVEDEAAHAAAAGGARHALRWAAAAEAAGGLYEGPLGAALAVLDVADRLGDGELRAAAAVLAADALATAGERPSPLADLLAGEAGTVIAALALERRLGGAEASPGRRAVGAQALGAARAAGDRLLAERAPHPGGLVVGGARRRRRGRALRARARGRGHRARAGRAAPAHRRRPLRRGRRRGAAVGAPMVLARRRRLAGPARRGARARRRSGQLPGAVVPRRGRGRPGAAGGPRVDRCLRAAGRGGRGDPGHPPGRVRHAGRARRRGRGRGGELVALPRAVRHRRSCCSPPGRCSAIPTTSPPRGGSAPPRCATARTAPGPGAAACPRARQRRPG